jgi:hypothetical protein
MTGFLGELSAKLADRWLSLLVLPGLLLVAAASAAGILGQAHALDITLLRAKITAVASAPGAHSPGVLLLAVGGILAASALAGLAGAVLGGVISRLWTAVGPAELPGAHGISVGIRRCLPSHWLTTARIRRWRERDRDWEKARAAAVPLRRDAALITRGFAVPPVPLGTTSQPGTSPANSAEIVAAAEAATRASDAALARRNRIATLPPSRPTWIGDRFHVTEQRITTRYHLDIGVAWPRLWALLPDNLRADLAAAYDAYTAASRLIGWALLYAALGAWWWPSLVIAAVTGLTGWTHGRTAAAVLADLIETTVDLHGRTLASQLGLACHGPLTADGGYEITAHLRKDLT